MLCLFLLLLNCGVVSLWLCPYMVHLLRYYNIITVVVGVGVVVVVVCC